MSRLFGGGGDDRSPPTERQPDKASAGRAQKTASGTQPSGTPLERQHALTWPSAGVPLEEALPLELEVALPLRPRGLLASADAHTDANTRADGSGVSRGPRVPGGPRAEGALRPEGNGVRWYPASRDVTPPVPRVAEPVQRISSPGLSLDAARMRAALVVSDTSLTEDELSAPSGRQTLPTLSGLGSALSEGVDRADEAVADEAAGNGADGNGAAGNGPGNGPAGDGLSGGAGAAATASAAPVNGVAAEEAPAEGGAAANPALAAEAQWTGKGTLKTNRAALNGSGAHAAAMHANGASAGVNGASAGVNGASAGVNGASAGVNGRAAHPQGIAVASQLGRTADGTAPSNATPALNGSHGSGAPGNGAYGNGAPGSGALVNGASSTNGAAPANGGAHPGGPAPAAAGSRNGAPSRRSARALAGWSDVATSSNGTSTAAVAAAAAHLAAAAPSGLARPPALPLGDASSQLAAAALTRELVEAPPADAVTAALELLVDLSFRLALGPVSEDWMVAGAGAGRVLQQASRAGWQPHLLASFEGLELLLTQGSRNRALPVLWRLSDSVPDWPSTARNLRDRARRCERRVVSELLASVDGLRPRPRSRFAQEKTLVYLVAAGPEQLATELDTPIERAQQLARIVQCYDAERRSSPVDIGHRGALRRATQELAERQLEFESGEEDLREARQRRRQSLTRVNLVLAERGDLEHLVELEPLPVAERIARLQELVGDSDAEGGGADSAGDEAIAAKAAPGAMGTAAGDAS